jgi:hypothetical protein
MCALAVSIGDPRVASSRHDECRPKCKHPLGAEPGVKAEARLLAGRSDAKSLDAGEHRARLGSSRRQGISQALNAAVFVNILEKGRDEA